MKHTIRAFFCAATAVFFLWSCASQKPVWLNNFDEAKTLAKKQNKNIFLFFSGADWDEKSQKIKSSVFDTDEFLTGVSKKYVLLNLDFSNILYEQADAAEDASEEEKAAAEKIAQILQKNGETAQSYAVEELPACFLVTKEGFVISIVENVEAETTPAEYLSLLTQSDERSKKINALVKDISKKKNNEKVLAIDALYEETGENYRLLLEEYFPVVIELDPQNTTGLVGKYEFNMAFIQAVGFMNAGMPELAFETFLAVSQSERLLPEEKQTALYYTAFSLLSARPDARAEIYSYLESAYNAAPESPMSIFLLQIMGGFAEDDGTP
jgi:thioredoxin-related protein